MDKLTPETIERLKGWGCGLLLGFVIGIAFFACAFVLQSSSGPRI